MPDVHDARMLVETLKLCRPERSEGPAFSTLSDAWTTADANALVKLAELEGAALWLHRKLKSLGITLTGDAQARLAALARNALAKSLRVDAETSAAFEILRAADIPFVPLKGAALRRIVARVGYVDARARADVDVLVRSEDAQRAWDVFVARGYAARTTTHEDGHHLPGLFGATGIGVELHLTTVPAVSPAEAWRRATDDGASAEMNGRQWIIPSDTELLWHATSHAMLTTERAARDGLRLRYWLDAAALIASSDDIDWPRIRARIESPETSRSALTRAWLHAATLLAGRDIPSGALGANTSAIDIERIFAWRLHVLEKYPSDGRWYEKLLDEGARGEARLPHAPHSPDDSLTERVRHAAAVRAARGWWRVHTWTS